MANTKFTPEELQRFTDQARGVQAQTGSLTISACAKAWGYATTSAARYVMLKLVDAGLVTKFKRGMRSSTYRVADDMAGYETGMETRRSLGL
jgi:DNA-binding transcriptional regulator GbsR (MarR family)